MLPTAAADNTTTVSAQLMDIQVPFIENHGQQLDAVKYYADTFYGTAYITDSDITHTVAVMKDNETYGVALKEQFVTADGTVIPLIPQGKDLAETKVSYFIGNDSTKWQTGIPTYNSVSLGELWPGIMVCAKAHGNNVEKIFTVAPGTAPEKILVDVQGAKSINVEDDGRLSIATVEGNVSMAAPKAFQNSQSITVAYRVLDKDTYGFSVGEYDKSKALVIDPSLEYSTYLGGSGTDYGRGIAVDSSNNAYVTGYTTSTNFPTTTGAYQTSLSSGYDVFVSKLNTDGSGLVYSTYLGGSGADYGYDIVLDSSDNVYITGYTASTNFPTTTGAYQTTYGTGTYDGFVTKLNSDGTGIIYSTYLGGSSADQNIAIAIDSSSNVYITGYTASTNFPTTTGAFQTTRKSTGTNSDAFVTKINPDGSSLVYSTYVGGTTTNLGRSIAVDISNNAYIAGYTSSSNFPTTTGAYQTTYGTGTYDGFVTKLNSDGTGIIYSTYLGGSGVDYIYRIASDRSNNAYVTGYTTSSNFPITTDAYQIASNGGNEIFVTKLNSDGTGLIYSTYLGGSDADIGNGLVVDSSGNAYVTGSTPSTNFPTTTGAFQTTRKSTGTNSDAFVTKINPDGSSLVYSTYVGGTTTNSGIKIATGSSDDIYIIGYTSSTNFPTTTDAYQTTYGTGTYDAFISKFSFSSISTLTSITLSPTTVSLRQGKTQQFTTTAKDQYDAVMTGVKFTWSCDNTTVGTVDSAGLFTATGVGAANISAVNGTVSGTAKVTVTPPAPDLSVVSITADTPVVNHAGTISVKIQNTGGAATGKFNVTLHAGSTEVNRTTVSLLGAAESVDVDMIWTPSASGSVTLTGTADPENTVGDADTTDNTVSKTVSVQAEVTSGPDLTVTREYSQFWVPYPDLLAYTTIKDGSKIGVMITNAGTETAPAFNVTFRVDGNSTNVTVPAGLTVGSFTYVNITDTVSRSPGATVPVNARVDSANEIPEISETNNEYSYTANVIWNGYNGRRWADGGPDIATQSVYPVNGNILYSNGDSTYRYVADTYYTHWTTTDLPIPANATIESARLYATYTWDSGWLVPDHITMAFNGKTIPYEHWYYDHKNWGSQYNYPFGVLIYDVTDQFSASGNTMAMDLVNRQSGEFVPFRGMTLVVVYNDPGESEKLIFLNEGFDIVFSSPTYYTTDETATAYSPFTGAEINMSRVVNATVTTILNRGVSGSSRGAMLFNGQSWPDYWVKTTDAEIASNTTVVTQFLKETNNVAMFRSQAVNNMDMEPYLAILNVEYDNQPTPPRASFAANTTSGKAGLVVKFRDRSTGIPTSWAWDFNNDGTVDNTSQSPVHTYTSPGTYTVSLTATNSLGSNKTVKNNYITVTLAAPTAAFTANKTAGDTPLAVQFTDTSTGLPDRWSWDFGDSSTSAEQNPVHTYAGAGTYTVKLTVNNTAGTDTKTKSGFISVNAKKVVDTAFNLTGVQTAATDSGQNVSIDTSQLTVTTDTTNNTVIIENPGNGWASLGLVMNNTIETSGTTINGTVSSVIAIGEEVIVPIPAVGSPKVHIELALDKLPDSVQGITQTITKDPDTTASSSFTVAAKTEGKNLDIGYTINFEKTGGLANAADGSGSILNATVYFAINSTWVADHGGVSKIVIMRRNDAGVSTFLDVTHRGTDGIGNESFSALSPNGLSTFIIAAVSPVSSGGNSGDSSGGSGSTNTGLDSSSSSTGGTSTGASKIAEKQKGKVYDYTLTDKNYGTTSYQVTTVSRKGRVEVTPLKAEVASMPDAKALWNADIVSDPDGGGKISTGIITSIPETAVNSYRQVLASQGLDVAAVAYAMSVEKDNRIGATKDGVIEMTAPQKWVSDNGGVEQVKIFRVSDEGTAELLTTAFSGYDHDTGYLTFRAESPDGLCSFTLMAVKPLAGGNADLQNAGTGQVNAGSSDDAGILTEVAPVGHGITYNLIIAPILIIAGCIGLVMIYRARKRDGN